MKRVFRRVFVCLVAVVSFYLGVLSAGGELPAAECMVQELRTAASDALDREKAERYLQEKLPILLSEMKKYLPQETK